MSRAGSTEDRYEHAQGLLEDYFLRKKDDEQLDFEVLVSAHPDLEVELRELFALCGNVSDALHEAADLTKREQERLEQMLRELSKSEGFSARYSIESEVGRGGMGVVYRVVDRKHDRPLAMKVILSQADTSRSGSSPTPRQLSRFLNEVKITGQLDHPGIVPVHEMGVDAKGRAYFTMKLVHGRTLGEIFERHARGDPDWSTPQVISIFHRICEALAYTHGREVIHRDLKPANIMVGDFGEVFIMDWGLARRLGEPVSETDNHEPVECQFPDPLKEQLSKTLAGQVVGTPAYMPPEQALGRIKEIGPHSDIYAVGAMLYHLIAGHPPYCGPDDNSSGNSVIERIKQAPPPDLRENDAPQELIAICNRAMARDRSVRFGSMQELTRDLRAFSQGRVVSAYETGAWAETRKWVRRNKPLAISLATGALVLIGGLVATSVLYVRAEKRADDVLRLSALQDVERLLSDVDDLWPASPRNIDRYLDWIDEAEALVADLPRHSAKRQKLRVVLTRTEDARAQWWDAQLTNLVNRLESLKMELLSDDTVTAEHGWSVPKRLSFAKHLEADFAPNGRYAKIWKRDLPAIREAYPGLDLVPQMGLIPIGPDPASNFWEFAHLMTGVPAKRGAEGKLILTEDSGVVLVLLPGSSFWMGAQRADSSQPNYDTRLEGDESPIHKVELSAYFISKYELSQGQWARLSGIDLSTDRFFGGTLNPAYNISWLDCMLVLPRFGLTLPTEAQWECAARAGTSTPWWTGEDAASLQGAANLLDSSAHGVKQAPWLDHEEWLNDGFPLLAEVGTLRPNGFGLHHVHGNVWEWCMDGYVENFYEDSPKKDPLRAIKNTWNRVERGGSYNRLSSDSRSSNRSHDVPSMKMVTLGARPVWVGYENIALNSMGVGRD